MIYAGFEIEVENSGTDHPDNIYKLMDATAHITGWRSSYGILEYHGSRSYTSLGKWGVERDSSLLNGAEFIMPPIEKSAALYLLEEFLSYVDESGCHTLTSCGLHLNISANHMTVQGMDKSYFLSNINHRLLYTLWRHRLRGTNIYCMPIQKIIEYTHASADLDTEIQNRMLLGKYRYVNRKITNNLKRLEIRVMGGLEYHKKIKEIKITTNMFCDILEKSYEKTHPKTKKRIISYINRIQNRKPECCTLWAPNRQHMLTEKKLFYLLDSIKTILEKENQPDNLDIILYRRYYNSRDVWKAYCLSIFYYIQDYITCLGPDTSSIKRIVQKTNETYYYIFKYLDKTQYDISLVIFDRFINGSSRLTDDYNVILTVPKNEKSTDVLWLCKHFDKLSRKAKKCFVNSLSLSALRFIKKKEILTMKEFINNREKQLIEEKQNTIKEIRND
jgi:hypothetical protein